MSTEQPDVILHGRRLLFALEKFSNMCLPGWLIAFDRSQMYGDSIAEEGGLSSVNHCVGCALRLRHLVQKEQTPENTRKVLDLLLDLHNYACFAYWEIKNGNWNGTLDSEPSDSE